MSAFEFKTVVLRCRAAGAIPAVIRGGEVQKAEGRKAVGHKTVRHNKSSGGPHDSDSAVVCSRDNFGLGISREGAVSSCPVRAAAGSAARAAPESQSRKHRAR